MNYGKHGVKTRLHYINPVADKLGKKLLVTLLQASLVAVMAAIVGFVCLGFGMIKGIIESSPEISLYDVSPTGYKTTIYDVNGNVTQELIGSQSNRVYVTLDRIPANLQHAFVAIEDERFYTHNGIDPKGIARATFIAFQRHSLDQGASTITQQLIKNNVFNAFNESTSEKIRRKIQEQYLAMMLEKKITKNEILENYLNSINLGNGNFGVQAAANNYFNKDVSELTLSECAVIAAITQRPEGLNPVKFPTNNAKRKNEVLKKMYEQKYITKEEYDLALADDVYARITNTYAVQEESTIYSYFVDALIRQVKKDLMEQKGYTDAQATNLIYKGGLTIKSTQDMNIQNIVNEEFANEANFPDGTKVSLDYALVVQELDGTTYTYSDNSIQYYFIKKTGNNSYSEIYANEEVANQHIAEFKEAMCADGGVVTYENIIYVKQPQASMTIMDQKTGNVVAIIGGRGPKTQSLTFNRATDSTRQPGSTFKIVSAYGPALDMNKITLATVIDDAPYHYSDGKLVVNYDNRYQGLNTVRYAIQDSRNIPAVKVLSLISPQVGLNYAQNFGFSTLVAPEDAVNGVHDMVESLCLGGLTYGVTNIDLCAAYAAIANAGMYNAPVYYTEVYDHDGNLLLDNSNQDTHRVIKSTTAEILTSALQSVTSGGSGMFTNVSTQPVAGKTGTTNDDVDRWYVGYTPYYTGAIWFGYDDNSSYDGIWNLHIKLWGKIMTRVHEGKERGEFVMSEDIVQCTVCAQSGQLAVNGLCDCDPRGSQIRTEYFVRGTEPTQTCQVHVKRNLCQVTNQLANSNCPAVYSKVFIKKSPELTFTKIFNYAEDSRYYVEDSGYTLPSIPNCQTHSGQSIATSDLSTTKKEEETKKQSETTTVAPTKKEEETTTSN